MENLILYNYFRSSTSYRVRIALHLKKLPFEYRPVHLLNNGGEQNQDSYRKLNPLGGVPTLVHNGFTLAQSSVIIDYLEEAFPQTVSLYPANLQTKSLVKQFCQIINADTHAYGNLKTLQYLDKQFNVSEADRKTWTQHWIKAGLTACEKMLVNTAGLFCFGNEVTAADLFLVPQMVSAERFEVDLTVFPKAHQIYQSCMKHPAFIAAHPFRQIDTPAELKIT